MDEALTTVEEAWLREHSVWELATPLQLLQLSKLTEVTTTAIAERLGVSIPLVSMWLHKKQGVPRAHRPVLLTWAQADLAAARARWRKEAQAEPTDELTRVRLDARVSPIQLWTLEVLHEAGTIERSIRTNLAWLGTLSTKHALTASDYRTIMTLMEVLQNQVRLHQDLAAPAEEERTEG